MRRARRATSRGHVAQLGAAGAAAARRRTRRARRGSTSVSALARPPQARRSLRSGARAARARSRRGASSRSSAPRGLATACVVGGAHRCSWPRAGQDARAGRRSPPGRRPRGGAQRGEGVHGHSFASWVLLAVSLGRAGGELGLLLRQVDADESGDVERTAARQRGAEVLVEPALVDVGARARAEEARRAARGASPCTSIVANSASNSARPPRASGRGARRAPRRAASWRAPAIAPTRRSDRERASVASHPPDLGQEQAGLRHRLRGSRSGRAASCRAR